MAFILIEWKLRPVPRHCGWENIDVSAIWLAEIWALNLLLRDVCSLPFYILLPVHNVDLIARQEVCFFVLLLLYVDVLVDDWAKFCAECKKSWVCPFASSSFSPLTDASSRVNFAKSLILHGWMQSWYPMRRNSRSACCSSTLKKHQDRWDLKGCCCGREVFSPIICSLAKIEHKACTVANMSSGTF